MKIKELWIGDRKIRWSDFKYFIVKNAITNYDIFMLKVILKGGEINEKEKSNVSRN